MKLIKPGNNKKPKISTPKISMPKIPLENIPTHKCPRCNHTGFVGGFELRPISKIISASGKDEIMQTRILLCSMCGSKVEKKDLFGKEV